MNKTYGLFVYTTTYDCDSRQSFDYLYLYGVSQKVENLVMEAEDKYENLPLVVLDDAGQEKLEHSYTDHCYIEEVRRFDY